MNMGTAMKAVGTGWKQSGTTDNGKGRDAGKADFADTFTEMLKAGERRQRAENRHRIRRRQRRRRRSQTLRRSQMRRRIRRRPTPEMMR